jgi:hypothetical protein
MSKVRCLAYSTSPRSTRRANISVGRVQGFGQIDASRAGLGRNRAGHRPECVRDAPIW